MLQPCPPLPHPTSLSVSLSEFLSVSACLDLCFSVCPPPPPLPVYLSVCFFLPLSLSPSLLFFLPLSLLPSPPPPHPLPPLLPSSLPLLSFFLCLWFPRSFPMTLSVVVSGRVGECGSSCSLHLGLAHTLCMRSVVWPRQRAVGRSVGVMGVNSGCEIDDGPGCCSCSGRRP